MTSHWTATTRRAVATLLLMGAAFGCGAGGANQGQNAPGSENGAIAIAGGDIGVAADGTYIVYSADVGIVIAHVDSGSTDVLQLRNPELVLFSPQRSVIYIVTADGVAGNGLPYTVHAWDVDAARELWATTVTNTFARPLQAVVSSDDRRIVLVDERRLWLIDATDGAQIAMYDIGRTIVDLDMLTDNTRALITHDRDRSSFPRLATISVLSLESGSLRSFDVANCTAELVAAPDAMQAFLAPTTCGSSLHSRDPVSHIDLTPGSEHFVRNLPGFGPVAITPDGTTAIAFFDAHRADPTLFDDPEQIPRAKRSRYHLMLIALSDLTYEFAPVGKRLPRYALTPAGDVLLIDSVFQSNPDRQVPVRLYDLEPRTFRDIAGPQLFLDDFVVTSDSAHAYVLDQGLYDIDISAATSAWLPLDFLPESINISPDDQTLYLRSETSDVCVFSLLDRRCVMFFDTGAS